MIKKYKYFVYIFFLILLSLSNAQSLQELQNMKLEYEKMKKEAITTTSEYEGIKTSNARTSILDEDLLIPYKSDKIKNEVLLDQYYFGYDFFTLRDSIPFWDNLPAPSNYLLGPGDEVILSIWGETQLRQTYIISKDGKIYDPKVGLLRLGGRSLVSAQDFLKSQFGTVYSTLIGSEPTSFIDLSLGNLRSINVNFVGLVSYPGVFTIHPFSSLITGLIQAGGVKHEGSLRNIKIIRENSIINNVDLYDYFINGMLTSEIQLRDQDIIVVPPRLSEVLVDSSVIRPGIYESLDGEFISDLIYYAGGPTVNSGNIVLISSIYNDKSKLSGYSFKNNYTNLAETKKIKVKKADKIFLYPILKELKYIEVIGQVKSKGKYEYFNGMTLMDALKFSGGIEDSTYAKTIYTKRAEIIRRNPKSRYEEVIPINLEDYLNSKGSLDIQLNNLDKIIIHANLNFFERENIIINGEVNVPGSYPLIVDKESLKSLINRSGGLTTKAHSDGISIFRNKKYFDSLNKINEEQKNTKIRVGWRDNNIALMPGDSIIVKQKTSTVLITGEIYNPGVLEFRSGKSINYYINSAGGLTDNAAYKQGINLVYANGIVKPKRWYSSPRVEEGSTIIVNKKIPEAPFDITQFATNWTSIVSSMITAIVLSKQL
tara:strand:+ start:139 stop:2103 length:1965 start_codon:yes stop_codon:yes gene_type:complete